MGITVAGAATSVYLLPGMSVKIKANHFFIKDTIVRHQRQDGSLVDIMSLNGFVVDNPIVGDITEVSKEPAVIYKHMRFEFNGITFYALTGEKGRVNIMSVPIHDHSSIVAGGPAYGTFFSDDETVSNDTEE